MSDNGSIVLRKPDMDDLQELGNMLISSGFFKDSAKVAQAAVKVLAGRELGLGPVESMRAFHIVEGKIEMSADLLAQRVKGHEKYDYRVASLTNDECTIQFFEGTGIERETLGVSKFTMEDAYQAGIVRDGGAWGKYPRNMLFARALSNGVGWFCPDVAGGSRIYVEGEISGEPTQASEVDPSSLDDAEQVVPSGSTVTVGPRGSVTVIPGDPEAASEGWATTGEPLRVDPETGEIVVEPELLTQRQRNHLFALATDLGYDDDQRRFAAGVESFNDLTKERASQLIEEWIALAGTARTEAAGEVGVDGEDTPASPALPESKHGDDPPSELQWEIALKHFDGNRNRIIGAAAMLLGKVVSATTITRDELTAVVEARLKKQV